jgi:CheY-like chemotaxis protein
MAHNNSVQILIVSSHQSVARLVGRMCSSVGYPEVEIASGAAEALEFLRNVSFGAVLLDSNLDVDDVHEFLLEVRASTGGKGSRLVLLTTSMTASAVRLAAQAGVNSILLKPFSSGDLKARLPLSKTPRKLAS